MSATNEKGAEPDLRRSKRQTGRIFMCGIIGIIGNGSVAPMILDGLRRLEYRGYDSAGIATIDASDDKFSLQRCRAAGKLNHLAEKLNVEPRLEWLALAIHVGQHMGRQRNKMPTHMRATMSSSFTMASLKTLKRCAPNWLLQVRSLPQTLTLRSSLTFCSKRISNKAVLRPPSKLFSQG